MRIASLLLLCSIVYAGGPGQEAFEKRCGGCHGLDHAKEGPPLRGVFGRQAGQAAGYIYSPGLKGAQFRWDEPTLDKWLADPESVVPNTDMAFRVPDKSVRQQIIEYLKHTK
jgi:cytochrome c